MVEAMGAPADGRKRLRAHWPPPRAKIVQVQLPGGLYARAYLQAEGEACSLAEIVRRALEAYCEPAALARSQPP